MSVIDAVGGGRDRLRIHHHVHPRWIRALFGKVALAAALPAGQELTLLDVVAVLEAVVALYLPVRPVRLSILLFFRHPGCRRVWAFFSEMSHLIAPKTLEILTLLKRENFV